MDLETPKLTKWTYIQCSMNLVLVEVNVNGQTNLTSKNIDPSITSTELIIKPGEKAKSNYGFLFLREIINIEFQILILNERKYNPLFFILYF